jgi:hypothetical protein
LPGAVLINDTINEENDAEAKIVVSLENKTDEVVGCFTGGILSRKTKLWAQATQTPAHSIQEARGIVRNDASVEIPV